MGRSVKWQKEESTKERATALSAGAEQNAHQKATRFRQGLQQPWNKERCSQTGLSRCPRSRGVRRSAPTLQLLINI